MPTHEAIENDVIKPIENVVNSVDGVKNIFATAREGVANINVEFRLDADIVAAAQEVRDKVAHIRAGLPREMREPTIARAESDGVRVEGKIKDPEGFRRVIVANQAGAPVYLDQVAEVVDGEAEETSISRVDGLAAVSLSIVKVQQSNIVQVGKGIEEAIHELESRLPEDVQIKTVWSNSELIEGSLQRVKSTIVEGAALTILIVFLFLHSWRSTVITGLTLPISVIATFIALHAFGFTLNFMTLMALSLCIGLLIDDAIVVRETSFVMRTWARIITMPLAMELRRSAWR